MKNYVYVTYEKLQIGPHFKGHHQIDNTSASVVWSSGNTWHTHGRVSCTLNSWVLTNSFIPPRVCPRCLGPPITAALLRLQSVVVVVFDLHKFFVAHPHPVVAWVLALLAARCPRLSLAPPRLPFSPSPLRRPPLVSRAASHFTFQDPYAPGTAF